MIEKYKNDFVAVAQEVDRTLEEISQRSESLETENLAQVETESQKDLKADLSYNSTYNIFDLIKKNLTKFKNNKVVREIDISNDGEKKKFKEHLVDIKYVEFVNEATDKLFSSPNDFTVVSKNPEGDPIPIFVPINSVYYYDDITLLYLLDISTKDEPVYRLIQFAEYKGIKAYWDFVLRKGKQKKEFKISQREDEKPQIIGFNDDAPLETAPFRQVSTYVFKFVVKDTTIFDSVEKLKIYKRDSDIFELSKILHAFPEKITIALPCKRCNAEGKITTANNETINCPDCQGERYTYVKNPAEVLKVPQEVSNDMKPYMSEPVKYVQKDINTLKFQKENLNQLEAEILYHATGLKNLAVNSMKTATEVSENQIPLNSKVNEIIDVIKGLEVWLIDTMGKLFTDKYESVTITYQYFYVGRTEEDILNEIKRGKESGLPFVFLNSLYIDWVKAYYRNDLQRQEDLLKLAQVEPYPFYTIAEINSSKELLNADELKIKININNYIGQLDLSKEPAEIKTELLTKIEEDEQRNANQSK